MRRVVKVLILASAIFVVPVGNISIYAQTGPDGPTESTDTSSTSGHWLYTLQVGNVFNSNINQDETNIKSFGVIPGFGIAYRSSAKHPLFRFNYEVGLHRYTNTDTWDRTSHFLETNFEKRFLKRFAAETQGVVSLKGSNEDRELADQYLIEEQIKYRINKENRFRVYAAYRIKRYRDDPGRNTIDPYIGAKYQLQHWNRSWTVGYRYDKSRSVNPRHRYIRWIYSGEFTTPLPGNYGALTLGARLQSKMYARLIRVDGMRVPRQDQKWIFSGFWNRKLGPHIEAGLLYVFEWQSSNQADKRFASHQVGAYIKYQFWR